MRYIQKEDRLQLQTNFGCLDDVIEANNKVRIIDSFAQHLDMQKLDFTFICRYANLIDFKLTAIDGSFFSAVNHNGKNYSINKIKVIMRMLESYIAKASFPKNSLKWSLSEQSENGLH